MATQNLGFGSTQSATPNQYDPNNQTHTAAMGQLAQGMQSMIASGNEVGARDLYNQRQQQYGFTDANFSPYTAKMGVGGANGFGADQIGAWKGSTGSTPGGGGQAPGTPGGAYLAAPAAQSGAYGYNADTGGMANLGQQQANQQLLSGQVNNPYLDAQANNIQTRLNRNLNENILPGIGQEAATAGGYGGSRMGIAQGKAIANMQDDYAGQMANLYGTANENAQSRMATTANNLSGLGTQIGMGNAQMQNSANQFNAAAQNTNSMFNAGQTNQYNLGMGNLGVSQQNANTNQMQANQSYNLGLGNLGLGYQNSNNQMALGLGNLGVSRQNANTNRLQANQSYNLGLGNLGLGYQNSANNYDLGLRSNDLGYANLDANIHQNNFNNQMTGANFGLNVYNTLQNGNQAGIAAGNNLQNTPLNYFNQFSNNANAIGNGYGTQTTGSSSNPFMNALGGAQLGGQIYNQFNRPAVTDGGYSVGQGNAYGGTTDQNGNFIPNRQGM